ncbi:DbpA RNA binding domain-containing protein [Candidatus Methanomethylophilus sp. 1R26]|uniref:DbpA RNA binding domain-containing protein n=1 Tax=Candidatus Methanomethylophilus sp. 1R26 TaxID=1769296 RepID=UPI001910F89D|nr:DbpA RNA binding domain-containing protein [Candidatus Methanomethylophilus sp. 1R26]
MGSDDGIDQDKLLEFVLKTAGIRREDVGNIHVYGSKSRVQVVRWRSQEVVDELFGHTVNGRRVMVSNLSDKQ